MGLCLSVSYCKWAINLPGRHSHMADSRRDQAAQHQDQRWPYSHTWNPSRQCRVGRFGDPFSSSHVRIRKHHDHPRRPTRSPHVYHWLDEMAQPHPQRRGRAGRRARWDTLRAGIRILRNTKENIRPIKLLCPVSSSWAQMWCCSPFLHFLNKRLAPGGSQIQILEATNVTGIRRPGTTAYLY